MVGGRECMGALRMSALLQDCAWAQIALALQHHDILYVAASVMGW